MSETRFLSRQRLTLMMLIFIFLAGVYMLTYSGRIESTDTLFLFDATESMIHFGDFRLDLSSGVRPPLPQHIDPNALYPLSDVNAERLQITLAAPLYWLANQSTHIGLVHTVYLLNIIVSTLAGAVVFLYTLALKYDERTAILASFTFGLGTIIWPYSKTFFQEPLTLLLLLLAGLFIERWRSGGYRSILLLLGAAVAVTGAFLTKSAALLALPALLVVALPEPTAKWERLFARLAVFTSFAVLLVAFIFMFINSLIPRIWLDSQFRPASRYVRVALHTYLFSIGGSIWGTSPVILLAIPGAILGRWSARQRYLLVLMLMLGAFAIVYAVRQSPAWFGGLSWPPRFLVPVMPFGILAALPALERVARGSRIWVLSFALLFAYSVWVQLSGVSLWWGDYASALPPESNQFSEWGGGLNDVRYLRWTVIPGLWSQKPLDFAWVRLNVPAWAIAFGVLTAVSGSLLWMDFFGRTRQALSLQSRRILLLTLPVVFVLVTWFGLRAIFDDDLYLSFNENLHTVLPIIRHETEQGDVVLLADLTYRDFFANYGKFSEDDARIVSLPYHPGEQPSPEQAPEIVSDNPDLLLHQTAAPLIHTLAKTRERLWLLASSSSFISWSVRPVERFMAAHYYPLREFAVGGDVRLIEYSTVSAPDPFGFRNPEHLSDLIYGDVLQLVGYDLPLGKTYDPGDVLPVSLYWRAKTAPDSDYKISLSLRAPDGFPKGQAMDTEPAGDLSHTSTWQANFTIWDNRALRLPAEAGEYQLWVIVYRSNPTGEAEVENLTAEGAGVIDGFIGVLPTEIQIR